MLYTLTRPHKYRSTLISNDNLIGMEALELTSDRVYEYLTYDMNKRQFHCMEVHLHPEVRKSLYRCNHLIWRDQFFYPVLMGELASVQVITISKSLAEVWNELSRTQYSSCSIPRTNLKQSSILVGETRSESTCKVIENMSLLIPTIEIKVWGDDSFVVMYDKRSLKVWQFNDFGLRPFRSTASKELD